MEWTSRKREKKKTMKMELRVYVHTKLYSLCHCYYYFICNLLFSVRLLLFAVSLCSLFFVRRKIDRRYRIDFGSPQSKSWISCRRIIYRYTHAKEINARNAFSQTASNIRCEINYGQAASQTIDRPLHTIHMQRGGGQPVAVKKNKNHHPSHVTTRMFYATNCTQASYAA